MIEDALKAKKVMESEPRVAIRVKALKALDKKADCVSNFLTNEPTKSRIDWSIWALIHFGLHRLVSD